MDVAASFAPSKTGARRRPVRLLFAALGQTFLGQEASNPGSWNETALNMRVTGETVVIP
jgi:hypothetical protein